MSDDDSKRPEGARDSTRPQDDDADRRAILARRRRFVTLALAGVGGLGCDQSAPQPCLSIAPVDTQTIEPSAPTDAGAIEEPSGGSAPTPGPRPPDAGGGAAPDATAETPDAGSDAGRVDAGDVPEPPKPIEPPIPKVCLRFVPPPEKK